MKHIQVFMAPLPGMSDRCEISGFLVAIAQKNGWTTVKWKEENTVFENRFPDWNIMMIRISDAQ